MSAVIRPEDLAAHIEALEEARSLHALIAIVRSAGILSGTTMTASQETIEVTADELVMILEARLSNVENKLANRGVTLKRPDARKSNFTIAEPTEGELPNE